jgi:hypothetical protein
MALSGALQTCDRFQLAPRATRRLNGHPTVAWNPLTATRKASTARRALTAVPRHVHADSRASAVGRRGARSYRTHKAAPARKSRRAAFRRVFARASRTGRSGRPRHFRAAAAAAARRARPTTRSTTSTTTTTTTKETCHPPCALKNFGTSLYLSSRRSAVAAPRRLLEAPATRHAIEDASEASSRPSWALGGFTQNPHEDHEIARRCTPRQPGCPLNEWWAAPGKRCPATTTTTR